MTAPTATDGFKVQWVGLFGAECVRVNENPATRWGCNYVIYSDFGEGAILRLNGTGPLTELPGFSPWDKDGLDEMFAEKYTEDQASWILEELPCHRAKQRP